LKDSDVGGGMMTNGGARIHSDLVAALDCVDELAIPGANVDYRIRRRDVSLQDTATQHGPHGGPDLPIDVLEPVPIEGVVVDGYPRITRPNS
jgi:hypothetical protein